MPSLKNSTEIPYVKNEEIELTWPQQGSAALGSLDEGVLRTSDKKEAMRPTASIAKTITALAVLEKKPVVKQSQGESITLVQKDVDYYAHYRAIGGSTVAVSSGEEVSQVEALEALLLASSNNMADTLADWAFGSIDAYVMYANNMVKSWGLASTVLADTNGISPETKSTPSDLIVIGQHFLRAPLLAEIAAKKSVTLPVAGTIINTNILLGIDGISGIKTGYTDEAGGCLLFSAAYQIDTEHNVTIIGVIQAAPTRDLAFAAAKNLLTSARKGFGKITFIQSGSRVGSYISLWNSATILTTRQSLTYYGWKAADITSQINIKETLNTVTAHQTVGTFTVDYLGKKYSSEISAQDTIDQPSIWWRFKYNLSKIALTNRS